MIVIVKAGKLWSVLDNLEFLCSTYGDLSMLEIMARTATVRMLTDHKP